MRGFGKSRAAMVCSIVGMVALRQIFLAVSMAYNHSVYNIYIGYPVGWFFSALFVMIYYFVVIRRRFRPEDSAPASEAEK